jgi:tRNA modification GTPase
VRVSGPLAADVARAVTGSLPQPRHAAFARFRAADGGVIDEGIALYFAAPHSYTGEDVLELQGHGGPVVMQALLARALELGARIAEPGEFTRRAFLNDRLDLAQAESVADLIDAASMEAARSAARSLTGEFSARIHELVAGLTDLRTHVEACIDFPEEEIDPADRAVQRRKLDAIGAQLEGVLGDARQGAVLREGLTAVLIGRPNVGKSSLLNRLAGDEVAIVTPIAGTTRDSVRVTIHLSGVPIHLVDTAGLRDAADEIERLGIERTWRAVEAAGAALFVTEPGRPLDADELAYLRKLPPHVTVARVINKIDLAADAAGRDDDGAETPILRVSAKTGAGTESLRAWLLEVAGWKPHGEGAFMARQRHLDALQAATAHVREAERQAQVFELMAEELRLAQTQLGRITGEVTADDVLGAIFARFCIGK